MLEAQKKAKLIWNCRRGMLELDLILLKFAEKHLDDLSDKQILALEQLIECPDPDIYAWLMGYETPANEEIAAIVNYIQLHHHIK